jgi:hypothetical protein
MKSRERKNVNILGRVYFSDAHFHHVLRAFFDLYISVYCTVEKGFSRTKF